MSFERMTIEEWFDEYQFQVDYDIGESGVKFYKVRDLNLKLDDIELRYTQHLGNPDLRKEIAKQYERLSGENIGVTTGAAESIFTLFASLTTPKDHIIIETPNYPSYRYIAGGLGRPYSLFQLKFEEKFRPNLDDLEKLIKPNTKLICLTHPNNPTGSVMTRDELDQVIKIVEKRNIYLILDETYLDMSFGKALPAGASLSDKVISVSTMSKVYGVPGIRIGWCATRNKDILSGVLNVREMTTICGSALNEAIALQLLQRRTNHLRVIKEKILSNYGIIKKWMDNQTQLEMIESQGSVTCFPRLKSLKSSEKLCRLLVTKYRTFTVPGYVFDMPAYLRLGFGGEKTELTKGLEQLNKAITESKTQGNV